MNESKNKSLKILEKIKEAKIKPRGKRYFILKNIVVWLGVILSLLFSAISFSAMIYLMKGIRLPLHAFSSLENWRMLISSLPYIWIIFTAVFIFLLYHELKRTKKGYLYPLSYVIIFAIISSTVLGYALQASGLTEKLDRASAFHPPLYNHVINPQMSYWNQAHEGRLTGMVVEDLGDRYFRLIAIDGSDWQIQAADILRGKIIIGEAFRLKGRALSENTFLVYESLPMGPGKGVFPHVMHSNFSPDSNLRPGGRRMMR